MLELRPKEPLLQQIISTTQAKKLVSVLATSSFMNKVSMKVKDQRLERDLYIQ